MIYFYSLNYKFLLLSKQTKNFNEKQKKSFDKRRNTFLCLTKKIIHSGFLKNV